MSEYIVRFVIDGEKKAVQCDTFNCAYTFVEVNKSRPECSRIVFHADGYEVDFWVRDGCPSCGGRGSEMTYTRGYLPEPMGWEDCYSCNGTGLAPIEPTAIELEAMDASGDLLPAAVEPELLGVG